MVFCCILSKSAELHHAVARGWCTANAALLMRHMGPLCIRSGFLLISMSGKNENPIPEQLEFGIEVNQFV